MTSEAVLLVFYSVALLAAAHGLHALGRLNTSPWAGRPLAGHRCATGREADRPGPHEWPHSEVPRLYTGVGLVAAGAATALSAGGLVVHHSGAEPAALAAVLALSVGSVLRMAAAVRH